MLLRPPQLSVATAFTLVAAGAVVALAGQPSPWDALRPATCMPDACFCEEIRNSFVRQPVNAMSGLSFLPIGLLILLSGPGSGAGSGAGAWARSGSLLRAHRVYPWLFGGATILVGLGTAFYHASLTFVGQTVDVLGMYLLATFLLLYNLARLVDLAPRRVLALYVAGNAALLGMLVSVPELRRQAFAALVLAVLVLEVLVRRRRAVRMRPGYLVAAGLVLAGGFVVWTIDLSGAWCDPRGWVQGHAVWHLAGAAATWLAFLYYRSEAA